MCGIAWRALNNHKHLYDYDHIASEKYTHLLFNITDLLSNIHGKKKGTFYNIVGDLTDRGAGTDCDLQIPKDAKTAIYICTQGKNIHL